MSRIIGNANAVLIAGLLPAWMLLAAAHLLGMSRRSLYRWIDRLGIES